MTEKTVVVLLKLLLAAIFISACNFISSFLVREGSIALNFSIALLSSFREP
jgi:hypothetical protein